MSKTLTRTENSLLSTKSSIGITEYTSSTGKVCTHPNFYPEIARDIFPNLWKDHFRHIIY